MTANHILSTPSLFGTDGIRGKANKYPITPELALKLGKAIGLFFQEQEKQTHLIATPPKVIIGRDTRRSGKMLEAALCAGLNSVGIDVLLTGVLPTPAIALLTREKSALAGVMISASHNPAEDNGIKIFDAQGYKPSDHDQVAIEQLIHYKESDSEAYLGKKIGRTQLLENALQDYLKAVRLTLPLLSLKGVRIALDMAHGAAFETTPQILTQLGATLYTDHNTPNGDNINDHCGSTFPQEITQLTLSHQADIGISHDGDADRVILSDEQGEILDGDEIMAMIATDLLQQNRLNDQTLVTTVMSNSALDETIAAHGGQVVRVAVGDRHVITAMRQRKLNFGGEQSGHLIFGNHSTTGDGLVAALQVLSLMQKKKQPLSELKKVLQKYPQLHRNIAVKEKKPLQEIPGIMEKITQIEQQLKGHGRILLRYSGTESLLRLLLEGPDYHFLKRAAEELITILQIGLS